MKGYWLILKGDVSDTGAQDRYSTLWAPIAARYGARMNPSTVPPLMKEARDAKGVILVEFPTYEAALACYDDPAYDEARGFALRAAGRDLIILKGELA